MTLAIMQPYFFPYIGYFQLIHAADEFILLDDVQYIRHGWINRNRILKPVAGHQYIIAPLKKHSQKAIIRQVEILDDNDWKEKILRQLEHYKKTAPYYNQVIDFLKACFLKGKTNISELNQYYLQQVCNYIGITTPIRMASDLAFTYNNVRDTDEWALRICEQLGAKAYINPIGGSALFDKSKFEHSGVSLHFLQTDLQPYQQFRHQFEPGLSIIDVMMFNSPEEIKTLLHQYRIV